MKNQLNEKFKFLTNTFPLNFKFVKKKIVKKILIMETCVLIPQEFSLVVATVVGSKKLMDPMVSVWSTAIIPQGTLCYPFQGTVRTDKLEVYSYVDDDDVSTKTKIFFHRLTNSHRDFTIVIIIILITIINVLWSWSSLVVEFRIIVVDAYFFGVFSFP